MSGSHFKKEDKAVPTMTHCRLDIEQSDKIFFCLKVSEIRSRLKKYAF